MEKWKKQRRRILGILSLVLVASAIAMIGNASASPKSMYLIADHHTAQFDAWEIKPDGTVEYQATYNLAHATDPAGISMDEDSATLFVTTEFSPWGETVTVEIVDATTMTPIGYVDEGVDNMAGIDVDQVNDIVFAVKRNTNLLYVFDWDNTTKTLTLRSGYPKPLGNCSNAFGIALDEFRDTLWVADSDENVVRAYDVSTCLSSGVWNENTSKTITGLSHQPVDVAVDRVRGFVYTVSMTAGAWTPEGTGSRILSKYDLATRTETTGNLTDQGVGVAVDEVTGYVYVTISPYGQVWWPPAPVGLEVWDTSTTPWTRIQTAQVSGSPAGIYIPQEEVAYNPLNLSKDDGVTTCVNPGDNITYTICFDNTANAYDVHNVVLTDNLPAETTFISATGGGIYNATTHTVTWNIGTLPAGATQQCVQLVVQVDPNTTPGAKITNYATIDSTETPATTVTEQTDICIPKAELCPDEYRWNTSVSPTGYEWDPYPTLFRAWNDVHFVNNGTVDAFNVTATITCAPVNVNIVDGTVTLGDIPAGSSAWSKDFFVLEVDMTNPQDPNKGICWRVEYDDAYGNHHVIENVPKFCGENCSDMCP